jgi:BirA family transcriptional regulator, biotin operon repressor / biotin---[acetyl-CoA-carboxylase] ligase
VTVRWHDRVTSTMDLAHAMAEAGEPHGTAVAAREQDAGRGRRGTAWTSPAGGLWISVLCRPEVPASVECLSLRAGMGVAAVLEGADPSVPPVRLKWPNDLYLEERKLGGVLCEARWDGSRLAWVVVGVGLNVRNPIPAGMVRRAVALAEFAPALTPEGLADPVADAVRRASEQRGHLTPQELETFVQRDWLRGRHLIAPVTGTGAGLSPDGSLLVEEPEGGIIRVMAGDVILGAA